MKQFIIISAFTALSAGAVSAQYDGAQNFQPAGSMASMGSKPMFVPGNRPDGQSGPVLDKPFYGIEIRHSTQMLSDGTHVEHEDSSRFYRDDRGRMRAESPDRVLIFDPDAGFIYDIDSARRNYRKVKAGDGGATTSIAAVGKSTWINTSVSRSSGSALNSNPGGPPSQGGLKEDLPVQMINGVQAKGSRITITIPVGAIGNDHELKVVNERWYSDDLQVLVKSSNSDPRFGTTTYELTDIRRGAPDPSLFQPPADYAVAPERH